MSKRLQVNKPQWVDGVALLRTSASTVRAVGDPEIRCLLDGIDARTQEWLDQLVGEQTWDSLVSRSRAWGLEPGQAHALLEDLVRCGLVVEAVDDELAGLGKSLATIGTGLVTDLVHHLVPTATRGTVVPRIADLVATSVVEVIASIGTCPIVVLELAGCTADGSEVGVAEELMSAGRAVLAVGAGSRCARVGPLAVPGMSSCLRCEDLDERDADHHWQEMSMAMAAQKRSGTDEVSATLAASEAIRQLRGFVTAMTMAGQLTEIPAVGAVLEMGYRGGPWRRRAVPRHRACGCWWSQAA